MRAILFLLSFGFAFSPSAKAEMSGRLHFEEDEFYESQIEPIDHLQDTIYFEFESKNNINDWARILFEPRVQFSSDPHLADAPFDFNTRDTLVEFKLDDFHIQVGSFIKQWEGPDGFNPMDIGTVKNYRDPLAAENLGSAGINFFSGGKNISWDAFYIPWQTPSRLPGENSRWLPRKTPFPLQSGQNTLLLPAQPDLQVMDHQEINSARENNYGGRIQLHGESWDLSFAAYQGASQLPFFKVHIVGDLVATLPDGSTQIQLRNPIQLQPVEYLRQTFAAGFVSTISDTWVFRVAGRFDQPVGNDPQLPGPSDQFVGGFEKTFTVADQTVAVSLGYAYAQTLDPPSGVLTITDPFQNAILYGTRFPMGDKWIMYYGGLWSHRIGATYNRIRFERKLGESFTLDFGGDILRGPPDNLLGIWAAQSRASFGIQYHF